MHLRAPIAASAAFIASVSAHATFQQFWIGSVDAGNSCARLPVSNSPVTSVTTADIACNVASSSAGVCPVNAGDTVTVEMHQQNGDRSCANEAIGGAHYGPITAYMAAVSDATSAVASSANWFKVSESGLVSNNPDYWAVQVLNNNCGHYTFQIPADIAPGNYLLRAEVIALHTASSVGGAQFYPGCFQINVVGAGTAKPPTVKFPGAYSATDPGIEINIYQSLTTYQIPGPTPYGSSVPTIATTVYPTTATWNTKLQPSTVPIVVPGGGSGTTTASSGTTTVGTTTSTTIPITTITKTSPTTTSVGPTTTAGGASLYGQCGGTGWT
ncbi:lytic polysaccharide monooxygenase [Hypholoma sublateritium FD-334 SS-4]|uniref:AA9 family lytic polysaccharide monooxygenase n=1 Tax=Hypholoma sublateritium (strain FD-334 SS-4) TaxID=945553 RepID=A0A0D2P3I3_HYPSF|nr:lytic polysaccharide monooxygenase [Hypholoma sublateritium FD-334 SS-4]